MAYRICSGGCNIVADDDNAKVCEVCGQTFTEKVNSKK